MIKKKKNLLGVSTTVGQTALQVTPFSAHSKATACEQTRIYDQYIFFYKT